MISIIVPCKNEQEEVSKFYTELMKALSTIDDSYEIIFVDDGSTDNTKEEFIKVNQHPL